MVSTLQLMHCKRARVDNATVSVLSTLITGNSKKKVVPSFTDAELRAFVESAQRDRELALV